MIVKRQTDGAGYLFNDNRAAGEGLQEDDIFGCNHCQKLVPKSQVAQKGGYCDHCGQIICAPCSEKLFLPLDMGGGCTPFVEKMRQEMERNYRREQNARILGI